MTITVLFFGQLADYAKHAFNTDRLGVDLPPDVTSTSDLKAHLAQLSGSKVFKEAIEDPSILCSVNQEIVKQCTVKNNDEVAFMSALSGG